MREFASNEMTGPSPWFSGSHTDHGLVIMKGDPLKQGARLDDTNIVDLAPTILYLLGANIPAGMDGRVLGAAFNEGFLCSNPARCTEGSEEQRPVDKAYSELEQEAVEGRLQAMGYL
jgi:hypothetical protein